ncbi:hypothetical protein [Agrobacterium salinitolerans]|uniref:hypothetical protein n=1 Tax=Agrobacterium salinitolerans TaxID=1183413 RepID=UPI0022B81F69|nr:hypothetical protein [Agrobacterium salinitolerans]
MTAHKKPKAESGRFGRFFVLACFLTISGKAWLALHRKRQLAWSELRHGLGGIASVPKMDKAG